MDLSDRHRVTLGTQPSKEQERLYAAHSKGVRGYAGHLLDEGRFEATVLMATGEAAGREREKVLLLAPLAQQQWVIDQLNLVANKVFAKCLAVNGDRLKLANYYGGLLRRIYFMGRVLQLQEQPRYWVAFGFDTSDPIPAWMPSRLLSV